MKFRTLCVGTLLLAATGLSVTATAGELTVEVSGVASAKGDVLVAVFDQKGQWLRRAKLSQKVVAAAGKVSVVFENLPEGEYALSAVHDLNTNGQLDSNAIGIPNEPYGFSNDAAGRFGPPSFDDAKISMDQNKKSVTIKLN